MSCSRHEGDWGPPEYGRIPVVCFGLLFGRHHAVWCDVGHGLTARDGRGLALHVIQLPAVVIRRGTIRERQTDLRGARGRHRGLPPASARLRHLHTAGRVRTAVHAPLHDSSCLKYCFSVTAPPATTRKRLLRGRRDRAALRPCAGTFRFFDIRHQPHSRSGRKRYENQAVVWRRTRR